MHACEKILHENFIPNLIDKDNISNKLRDNNSTSTDEDARSDVKANGLCGSRVSRTFFDVKVFNPPCRLLKDAYKYYESLKNSKQP